MLRLCYAVDVRTITHRELRNDSGRVLREVANGDSILISNNGVTVARISPAGESGPDLHISRAATKHGFDDVPMHDPREPTVDVLDDLRGDR